MAKRKNATAELPAATEPTTVLGKKHIRRKYSPGDDYKAWKAHCDQLKVDSAFHSSEATRLRNEFKKCYENGADGFCNVRDDKAWEKANNLITLAEMKESERANAWKSFSVEKLDLREKLIETLKENGLDTIGKLSAWLGLGEKAIEKLGDAVNKFVAPYHAPITNDELAAAKAIQRELAV